MNHFEYTRAADVQAALAQIVSASPDATDTPDAARFIAGGTNLLDLMQEHLVRPRRLVDISRLPLDTVQVLPDGRIRLGALARNADTAHHPAVREQLPLLSSAILAGASPQILNMASNGGNLLQRTRCAYFHDAQAPCNKREPGSGCSARKGVARQHAILGASEHCVAVHPSDMCVALAALGAVVHARSPRGERDIAFADFHRLPGDTPQMDTTLAQDELIEFIDVPASQQYAAHSVYLKLRERQSHTFALVSVAAALDMGEDGRIRSARLALGGVAHKPWRDLSAEWMLAGQVPEAAIFKEVAALVLQSAVPHGVGSGSSSFKIPMVRRAIVRALEMAAKDGTPSHHPSTG
ncbi:xanthine dehydrogenase family protein subunit M [Hydrogenophaga sp. 2FB]|uniref:FAD binding domain-containing protein n=1 Tax=Hydrogenophaga sp. 2FB TaxID=2502187 RepID=UPI0010F88782|nr:xanthine dehydrogenase family protein subunit M [Hydrogenophaga sp. 2FB]